MLAGALSAVIKYHNTENRPKTGICVANHTSVIDVLVLACDNAYSLIGQKHGGIIGFFERQLSKVGRVSSIFELNKREYHFNIFELNVSNKWRFLYDLGVSFKGHVVGI